MLDVVATAHIDAHAVTHVAIRFLDSREHGLLRGKQFQCFVAVDAAGVLEVVVEQDVAVGEVGGETVADVGALRHAVVVLDVGGLHIFLIAHDRRELLLRIVPFAGLLTVVVIDKADELAACLAGELTCGTSDEHLVAKATEGEGADVARTGIPFADKGFFFGGAVVDLKEIVLERRHCLFVGAIRRSLLHLVGEKFFDSLGGKMLQVGDVVGVGDAGFLSDGGAVGVAATEGRRGGDVGIALESKAVDAATHDTLDVVVLWEVAGNARLAKWHRFCKTLHERTVVVVNKAAVCHVHPVHKDAVVGGLLF